jgi:DNA gyrase/topoisomerase IV subunit A
MDVLDRIIELAREEGADALLELTVASTDEALYDAAIEQFGSWDGALARAVVKLAPTPRTSSIKDREEEVVRKRSSAASDPVFTRTTDGGFFWIDGEELDLTEDPELLPTPEGAGPMERMWWVGDPDGVFVFSDKGRYYGLITRVVPQWMGETPLRPWTNILSHMDSDEKPMLVLPRRAGRSGRIVHVTKYGKGKASDADEYGRTLDQTGREAFLLKDGDTPVAVMHGTEDATVFCASAKGLGIHFEATDLRSMGRKAIGVNVMKLDGDDDHIVNAFHGDGVEQLAVVTKEGLCKRIWFDDFRTQGRGGAGMQVAKRNDGDYVVGVVPCVSESDIVITTSIGRVWRTEATTFELMGRPAKGNPTFDLLDGEEILGLSVLPTSTDNF